MRGSIQKFMDEALSSVHMWEKMAEDYNCARYAKQAKKCQLMYDVEKRFHDNMKKCIDESHQWDDRINEFIDKCVKEYNLSGYGFPTTVCSDGGGISFRPEVIRMCVYMLCYAFHCAPTERKRRSAPRVVEDKYSHSYALKHVLEDWLDYLYGPVAPHYSYVSNGEGCVVAMYLNQRFPPNIIRTGKIPPRYGRQPNIDLSYSNVLREFMHREPYYLNKRHTWKNIML